MSRAARHCEVDEQLAAQVADPPREVESFAATFAGSRPGRRNTSA